MIKLQTKKLLKFKNFAFLTANTKQAFNQLKQALTETPIFSYFDLKYNI